MADDPRDRPEREAGRAGEPPAADPPAGEPPAADPPAGDPPTGDPPAGDPPAGEPPAANPLAADPLEHESAYSLLQRGQALVKSRHHAQAAIVLGRAARLEPGKGSILEPLGRAYHHSGQFERARETFEALLEVDPSAHWAHFALATSLRKLDRLDEARTHLRLAVALAPKSELYRQALRRLEARTSKSDAA